MNINRSVDIEDEVRQALEPYATVYVRPLPKDFTMPSTLIECVGGTTKDTIDTFSVKLSTRARTDAEAKKGGILVFSSQSTIHPVLPEGHSRSQDNSLYGIQDRQWGSLSFLC